MYSQYGKEMYLQNQRALHKVCTKQHSLSCAYSQNSISAVFDPLHQKVTKAQNMSSMQQTDLYIPPQTDRKRFFLQCAEYCQPAPFFIEVITAWCEALCGSRCHVTGVWFPWRLPWLTWDTRVINIPLWWPAYSCAWRTNGVHWRMWMTEYIPGSRLGRHHKYLFFIISTPTLDQSIVQNQPS